MVWPMFLRRHAPLITALALIALVTTACLIRTGPPRRGGVYRTAPGEKHEKYKPKKAKKHQKR